MDNRDDSRRPDVLRGTVTLTQCIPDGPVMPDGAYRVLGRTTFRDVTFFSRGATCNAYEAVDPWGNRRIITEFCPGRFYGSLYRTAAQELRLWEGAADRDEYWIAHTLFIAKWNTQQLAQSQNRLHGNNGPQLYFLGETPYLVMNYDGQPLRDFGTVDPEPLIQALIQAADAIEQEHRGGLLMNDIKPDNLLFTGQGDQVLFRRLLDYGSALPLVRMRGGSSQGGAPTSTRPFCSPELEDGDYQRLSFASDVYSFGQTVLHMLCGLNLQHSLQSQEKFCSRIDRNAPADAPVRRLKAGNRDAFYTHLYSFALHTLSEEIMDEEERIDWQTDPYMPGWQGPRRLCRMGDVRQLLVRLQRAAQPAQGPDLYQAWTVARRKAAAFETGGFGNSSQDQWELERRLFSKELLARYQLPDSARILTLEELADEKGCLFLEGTSGCGKSVGLRWLYSHMAAGTGLMKDQSDLPVYISMERAAASGLSLRAYVARELFEPGADRAAAEAAVTAWLSGKAGPRLVLLCDGINEIRADSAAAPLLEDLYELAGSAGEGRVGMIISGQNKLRELPNFPGRVLRAQPPEWSTVRAYLYSRLPVTAGDGEVAARIDNLRRVLSTPQQIHDLCVPHVYKTRLHPRAIPDSIGRLLHDFFHGWCAKEKIHRAVCGFSAYSSGQQNAEPYGERLLEQLGQLCWLMTRTDAYSIEQSVLRDQLRMVLRPNSETDAVLGCACLTQTEERQVMSLLWCGVLFELDSRDMRIRHESYRDYLAAEYLAGVFGTFTETGFPAVLMQPIPDNVMKHLVSMVSEDALQRLCDRIRAEKRRRASAAVGRYFINTLLDQNRKHESMSVLHKDNLIQASNNLYRLVQARPLSNRTRHRMLRGLLVDPRLRAGADHPSLDQTAALVTQRGKVSGRLTEDEIGQLGTAAVVAASGDAAVILWRWLSTAAPMIPQSEGDLYTAALRKLRHKIRKALETEGCLAESADWLAAELLTKTEAEKDDAVVNRFAVQQRMDVHCARACLGRIRTAMEQMPCMSAPAREALAHYAAAEDFLARLAWNVSAGKLPADLLSPLPSRTLAAVSRIVYRKVSSTEAKGYAVALIGQLLGRRQSLHNDLAAHVRRGGSGPVAWDPAAFYAGAAHETDVAQLRMYTELMDLVKAFVIAEHHVEQAGRMADRAHTNALCGLFLMMLGEDALDPAQAVEIRFDHQLDIRGIDYADIGQRKDYLQALFWMGLEHHLPDDIWRDNALKAYRSQLVFPGLRLSRWDWVVLAITGAMMIHNAIINPSLWGVLLLGAVVLAGMYLLLKGGIDLIGNFVMRGLRRVFDFLYDRFPVLTVILMLLLTLGVLYFHIWLISG